MSGWRQDQYLDQAYHAWRCSQHAQPLRVRKGFHWQHLMTERGGGDAWAMIMSLGISPVRFGSHRIRTTARAALSGGQQGSAEDTNNIGWLCGPAGRSPKLRRNQVRPVNPARSVPSRDGRGLRANADALSSHITSQEGAVRKALHAVARWFRTPAMAVAAMRFANLPGTAGGALATYLRVALLWCQLRAGTWRRTRHS
jgi:hypothetical protein